MHVAGYYGVRARHARASRANAGNRSRPWLISSWSRRVTVGRSVGRSIDIQQEVEVATQSTPRKGLHFRAASTGQHQKPPVARARNRDSEASREQQAPGAKKMLGRGRWSRVVPLGLKGVVPGW